MIVFSLKLLNNVRKAIAGRRFPRQLAGGVALGAMLGIVPHGNLLALLLLLGILCFRVNHALMGVVAIVVSFGGSMLDPYSHRVGDWVLNHPTGHQWAAKAWTLPLVPWTDLNNTVVLGSFLIGLAGVLPLYLVTLPVFKWIAPAVPDNQLSGDQVAGDQVSDDQDSGGQVSGDQSCRSGIRLAETKAGTEAEDPSRDMSGQHAVALYVDDVLANDPEFLPAHEGEGASAEVAREASLMDTDHPSGEASDPLPTQQQMVAVETRIDVVRMKDYRDAPAGDKGGAQTKPEQPMDEALNYLLRQLRDSQERKAAG